MSDYGKLKYSDASGKSWSTSLFEVPGLRGRGPDCLIMAILRLTSALSEYDSSQSGQDPMYLSYVQPSFSQPHAHSSSAQYERHVDQVPYAPSALYQPHAQIEGSQSSYIDPPSRQIPEVSSFSPQQGPLGTQVYIKITASYDLLAPPVVIFSVMFARKRCRSIISRADGGGPYCHYLLATEAPPFASTGWAKAQVPLRLHFQDDSGIGAGAIEVGSYTYTDAMQQSQTSPPEFTRKRKISFESADITGLPAKRTSAQHLHPGALDPYGPYSHQLQGNSGYLQKPQSFGTDSSLGNLNPYNRPSSQQSYRLQDSPRRVSHHLSTSSASSLSQLRAPSPQTPSWSPARSSISQQNRSPALAVTPATRISSVPSPNKSNPPLIRTSTLQQSPSPAATPVGPTTAGSFNPYAMYPHKAVLKINGDLGTMAENWVSEEWDARRRLVQFWRSQSGSTINTHFKPVSPEDRLPNSICISCIWWEQKKECYVTSVDTIYLLESLVAVRFTVEEKNRIRRNLEGFHPMTVSKGKSDSEDFFKLIMGFPNPKPRNIEKDVKVFPWKVLSHALKKIIGKYVSLRPIELERI